MTPTTMNTLPTYWQNLATTTKLPALMWIDSRETSATGDATTALITPRDGSVLAHVAAASAADVDHAVTVAARAFSAGPWPRMSPRERGDVLIRWADLVKAHRDELALLISLEMGKPISDAWQIEVRTAIHLLRWYGEISDKLLDESPRGRPDSVALVTREPLGVIAAITPWNFPLTLSLFKIPAALVSGNTLILKPASQAPLSSLRLAQLGSEAGLPDGVFQVLTGSGAVAGKVLACHDDVAALTFTGSTTIGKQLLHFAGDSNAKPVYLELGGKSPNIIFPDAPDMARAIDMAAWAISFNAGQMCTAGSRLLVHRDVHDQVLAGVITRLSALRSGDPLDPATQFGPLSSRGHRDDVLAEIRAGAQTAAELVLDPPTSPPATGSTCRRRSSTACTPMTGWPSTKCLARCSRSSPSTTTRTPSTSPTTRRSGWDRRSGPPT